MRIEGKSARPGLLFCGDCRTQFTVTVGTVFERSKVPLHKWVLATHLMCSSKKSMSAHQLHRTLGVTYKTAWFMSHRIRESMTDTPTGKLGGGTVEADETFWGNKSKPRKNISGWNHSMKVVSLVERDGHVRSFHVPMVNAATLKPILLKNIHWAKIITDQAGQYHAARLDQHFISHESVNHITKEYARGNAYQRCRGLLLDPQARACRHVPPRRRQHLQCYVNEFDFRYNFRSALGVSDVERTDYALQGMSGKRLTYRRTLSQVAQA